jgi:hypothetical protein
MKGKTDGSACNSLRINNLKSVKCGFESHHQHQRGAHLQPGRLNEADEAGGHEPRSSSER